MSFVARSIEKRRGAHQYGLAIGDWPSESQTKMPSYHSLSGDCAQDQGTLWSRPAFFGLNGAGRSNREARSVCHPTHANPLIKDWISSVTLLKLSRKPARGIQFLSDPTMEAFRAAWTINTLCGFIDSTLN